MAAPQYSTAELIANIKRRCAVPSSQTTYTDADFTALATDELQGEVVPLVMSTREEYFVEHVDVLSVDAEVSIPEQAVGEKLRSVCYVQPGRPLNLINVPRIDLDVVAGVGFPNYASMVGFYVQGNKLMLWPNNSVPQNTTIRLYYYKRALVLAPPFQFGRITTVDPDTNTVVLSFLPYEWETGDVLNTVCSKPPFNVTNSALTIVSTSSPSLILDTVEGIEVGDYISVQGTSAVPQIPIEAHAYLAQLTGVKCLEGLGDRSGMEAAQAKAEMLKKNLLTMISQRVDGSVKKVVNPNGGLRMNSGIWRRGWGGW